MKRQLYFHSQTLRIRGIFRISRGSKTIAETIVVKIEEDGRIGRGECVPYARYGETLESVSAQITSVRGAVEDGASLTELQSLLPPGSARNAVDCALWELRARLSGRSIASYAGLERPLGEVVTCFTISLDNPERMADAARSVVNYPLLKLKLGGEGDLERVRAVRKAVPGARLMADANESWKPEWLDRFLPEMAELGVELLEQPLPAGEDAVLEHYRSPVPLAADESCRDLASVSEIRNRYNIANIKLDKTGGLTEALALARASRSADMKVMIGCMVASSLSMAPGLVIAQLADIVHLDGPLLLLDDVDPGYQYAGATLTPDDRVWPV